MFFELLSSFIERVSINYLYLLTSILLSYAISVTIHRLFFAPLCNLPGPKLAGITRFYILYYDYYNSRSRKITRLHKKYGPVVRIAPNEVSFTSPIALKDIYIGSSKEGAVAFPKTAFYSMFTHFDETNMFSSLESADHSWKRRVIAGAYSASYVIKKEEKDGNLWRTVGDYIDYVEREGVTSGDAEYEEEGKAVDIFIPNVYYAADVITSHLFGKEISTKALKDAKEFPIVSDHRRMIDATSDKSTARRAKVYLTTDFGTVLNAYESLEEKFAEQWRKLRGIKLPPQYIGGSEIREYGYNALKAAKAASAASGNVELVSERLAQNVNLVITSKPDIDTEKIFNQYGATSECLDHFLAGMDTSGDTLSFLLYSLSLPQNRKWQDIARDSLPELPPFNQPLSGVVLAELMADPYLNALVKETLLLYPAIPVSLPRMTPKGGRTVDKVSLPEGVIASASVEAVNRSLIDSTYPRWDPSRWLDDEDIVMGLERRLWSFSSGGRGCIGKHLALFEIKLLLAAILSKYELFQCLEDKVVVKHTKWIQRSTFRDVMYLGDVKGIVRFVPVQ